MLTAMGGGRHLAAFATFFSSIQEALGTLEKGYHPEHAAEAAEAEAKAMVRRDTFAANRKSGIGGASANAAAGPPPPLQDTVMKVSHV